MSFPEGKQLRIQRRIKQNPPKLLCPHRSGSNLARMGQAAKDFALNLFGKGSIPVLGTPHKSGSIPTESQELNWLPLIPITCGSGIRQRHGGKGEYLEQSSSTLIFFPLPLWQGNIAHLLQHFLGVPLPREMNVFLDNQLQNSSILSQHTAKTEPNPSSVISSGP